MTSLRRVEAPTEVDHYQLQRVIDIYVAPSGEELGKVANAVNQIISQVRKPDGVRVFVRGSAAAMTASLQSFGFGLILSLLLVYLILVAQFRSFIDPLIIMLAVPPGISGVLLILTLTGTTLNVMSLMGVVMMVGIVVSNSILIVEFTHRLIEDGMVLREAVTGRGPGSSSPDFDDFAGHDFRTFANGSEARHRDGSLCAAGSCYHWGIACFSGLDRLHRAVGGPAHLSTEKIHGP